MEVSQQEKGGRYLPFASAYTVVPPTPNQEEQTDPTPTPWSFSPCGCSPSSSAPTHSSNGRHTCPPQLAGQVIQEAPSTFCFWPLDLPPESVLGRLRSSRNSRRHPSHLQPLASSHSLAGLPGRWENTGPCLCCGVAVGCWASTPPFLAPSLRPGSDLTWELTPEHMLGTVCLSHGERGHRARAQGHSTLARTTEGADVERGSVESCPDSGS